VLNRLSFVESFQLDILPMVARVHALACMVLAPAMASRFDTSALGLDDEVLCTVEWYPKGRENPDSIVRGTFNAKPPSKCNAHATRPVEVFKDRFDSRNTGAVCECLLDSHVLGEIRGQCPADVKAKCWEMYAKKASDDYQTTQHTSPERISAGNPQGIWTMMVVVDRVDRRSLNTFSYTRGDRECAMPECPQVSLPRLLNLLTSQDQQAVASADDAGQYFSPEDVAGCGGAPVMDPIAALFESISGGAGADFTVAAFRQVYEPVLAPSLVSMDALLKLAGLEDEATVVDLEAFTRFLNPDC